MLANMWVRGGGGCGRLYDNFKQENKGSRGVYMPRPCLVSLESLELWTCNLGLVRRVSGEDQG